MPPIRATEHIVKNDGHDTFYLAAGPEDGPLVILVHGWPELSISWRHQLPFLAAMGFRAVAPDMRGYGRSSAPDRHEAYAQQAIVGDMLALLDHLGAERAVWVGHDWGSPTVWSLASHHPERCAAVASLCVPYRTLECGLDACLPLLDRALYPEADYPAGQWDYQRYYEENFERAVAVFDANPLNSVKALFRKGNPADAGKPARTATTRKDGGWFAGADEAPDVPRDGDVVAEEDLAAYARALERNGFFGPCSYYMNHLANAAYAATAVNDGRLEMPVLFLLAQYDFVCECVTSSLAAPMFALVAIPRGPGQAYSLEMLTPWYRVALPVST